MLPVSVSVPARLLDTEPLPEMTFDNVAVVDWLKLSAPVTLMLPVMVGDTPLSTRTPRIRPLRSQMTMIASLLALAAVAGVIAALALWNGDHKSNAVAPPKARTVTITNQGTTVERTVTTPSAPPTSAPPPPSPPPATASSLSGSQLNDAGYARMRAGDYAGALPLLRSAVTKLSGVGYPTEAYANYNLGYTLLQLGSCDAAIPYLEQAKRLEPQRREPKDALKRAQQCTT